MANPSHPTQIRRGGGGGGGWRPGQSPQALAVVLKKDGDAGFCRTKLYPEGEPGCVVVVGPWRVNVAAIL